MGVFSPVSDDSLQENKTIPWIVAFTSNKNKDDRAHQLRCRKYCFGHAQVFICFSRVDVHKRSAGFFGGLIRH